MTAIPRVLHRNATPVSLPEFHDAVTAICRPRFPGARRTQHRPVALGVSGGVDSMALAHLCARANRWYMNMQVADNTAGSFTALIVNHNLRPDSDKEAHAVHAVVARMGMRTHVLHISHKELLQGTAHTDPKDLPNLETVARRLRYRKMTQPLSGQNIASLFLAHHEDDQYETVLMRLLAGHGAAGLHGMRAATDIPECYGVHGVYQSGFVDDQAKRDPMINFRPVRRQMDRVRLQMLADMDPEQVARETAEGVRTSAYLEDEFDIRVPDTQWLLPTTPPEVEDGGVMVYRPLLEFGKDRLVATCEANGVPWFEDHTNRDPTLTTRNAVRHMCKYYNLPMALQKPAILAMSRRLRTRAELDEAEAGRLLGRTLVRDFQSTAGTVVVQLPRFRIPRFRRNAKGRLRRLKRLEHYRTVAALLTKRLVAMVTPELPGSFGSNLQNTVLRLFPSLNDKPSAYPRHPKAFNVCGVHFLPVRTSARRNAPMNWYLSREPYVSHRPRPMCRYSHLALRLRWRRRPEHWRWACWRGWQLWDGRFWVRIRTRGPVHVACAPFEVAYAKAFRDSLASDKSRDTLMAVLKLHAPGKVRWTLPAIYTRGDLDEALKAYEHFADMEKAGILFDQADLDDKTWNRLRSGEYSLHRVRTALEVLEKQKGEGKVNKIEQERVMVALPTLGIAKPGLSNWIEYEVRYRRVDRETLDGALDNEQELAWVERMKAMARTRGRRRWAAGTLIWKTPVRPARARARAQKRHRRASQRSA